MPKFVSYLRVSTQRQGHSGLGLEAQRDAVAGYLKGRGELIAEFKEVESGRSKGRARPQLEVALRQCRKAQAALVVGKLDRLSRDLRFFLQILDDSRVDIRFADLPDVCPATAEGRMILVSMANFAEFEARRISTRTKAALQAAKKRGVLLGQKGFENLRPKLEERMRAANDWAEALRPLFDSMHMRGLSQRAMADELNRGRVPAPRGGGWRLTQVQRTLARLSG